MPLGGVGAEGAGRRGHADGSHPTGGTPLSELSWSSSLAVVAVSFSGLFAVTALMLACLCCKKGGVGFKVRPAGAVGGALGTDRADPGRGPMVPPPGLPTERPRALRASSPQPPSSGVPSVGSWPHAVVSQLRVEPLGTGHRVGPPKGEDGPCGGGPAPQPSEGRGRRGRHASWHQNHFTTWGCLAVGPMRASAAGPGPPWSAVLAPSAAQRGPLGCPPEQSSLQGQWPRGAPRVLFSHLASPQAVGRPVAVLSREGPGGKARSQEPRPEAGPCGPSSC